MNKFLIFSLALTAIFRKTAVTWINQPIFQSLAKPVLTSEQQWRFFSLVEVEVKVSNNAKKYAIRNIYLYDIVS